MSQEQAPTAEWDLARDRRAPSVRHVLDSYAVRNGCIEPADPDSAFETREYYPLGAPAMLGDFYEVIPGDALSALAFVRRWGLLGFHEILSIDTGRIFVDDRDPLPWIWAHANGIRIAMDLMRLVRRQDEPATARYLDGLRAPTRAAGGASVLNKVIEELVSFPHPTPERNAELMESARRAFADTASDWTSDEHAIVLCARRSRVSASGVSLGGDRDAISVARNVVAAIVNPNLAGVFDHLQTEGDAPGDPVESAALALFKSFDSLMSCLYRHLAELALGGTVLECRECGTPFVRRHGRQVFCPAPPWARGGASRCAERWKKREQRKRAKQQQEAGT